LKRDSASRPRGTNGVQLKPMAQPGYYPGYSTLAQKNYWDAKTRQVVTDRVNNVPPRRFFTPVEAELMEAICARIVPQNDRDEAHQIPIVPQIDERLHLDRHEGYRYADMPPQREAFRLGMKAIEEIARHLHERGFVELAPLQQDEVLKSIHDGKPPAGQAIWQVMSVHHFWLLLVQACIEVYYAHPWAWDEIGYGGPAYPRGYMRLERGDPEPWETEEQRYEWEAPEDSLSDIYEPIPSTIERHRREPEK
jgi:hypothetical protein